MYGKKIIGSNPVAMYGSSTSTLKRAGSQIRNTYTPHKRSRLNDDPSDFESSGRSQTHDSRRMPPPSIDRYVPTHHSTDRLYQAPSATSYRIGVLKENVNVQQSKTLAKADFYPGMIIRCALHESDYMGAAGTSSMTLKSKFQSQSNYGPVFTKVRIMIVVACYESSYIALPLYTHNGNGLSNKSPSQRQEYVSVQDHRLEGHFTALSRNGVLRTEFLNDGIFIIDPVSTVHLTYHHSRSYSLPVVHQGHLTMQATKRLIKLYNEFAPRELPQ